MIKPKYKFFKMKEINTSIPSWNKNRKRLNKVTKAFNKWQINGFDPAEAKVVAARIEFGLQTFGDIGSSIGRSGPNDCTEQLEEMKLFMESYWE